MAKVKVGRISAGLLLVVIGVIILLTQIYNVSAYDIIEKWWPIVLIVFGLEILIQSILAKSKSDKLSFDFLSMFIVIIVLIASMLITGAKFVYNEWENGRFWDFFPHAKYETTYNKTNNIKAEDLKNLTINNDDGRIVLSESKSGEIEVDMVIKVANNNEDYVNSLKEEYVKFNNNGSKVEIISLAKNIENLSSLIKDVYINFDIKVPVGVNVYVKNDNGEITADRMKGNLELSNDSGHIMVNNIEGNIKIDNDNGNIKVEYIQGDVIVDTDNAGEVRLENIKGLCEVKSDNSRIEANEIEGDIDIRNNNGKISVEEDAVYGNMKIESGNGNVEVDIDKFDNCIITGEIDNGVIDAGGEKTINGKYKKELGSGEYTIEIIVDNGKIDLIGI